MNISDEDKVFDDINVTPMLDLAYVLLIIFIILCTATTQGIKVNLPKASNAPSLNKPQTKSITVMQDGSIFLDAYPVSIEQLETMLRQYKAVNPELPVVVKADSQIQYQRVVDIMDVLSRVEISQLGLVTQKAVK